MNYNLLYGAYGNADQDGASDTWRLFQDPNHQSPEFYQLPSSWASNLYIMDPGNQDWRDYIFAQERKAFLAIPFDSMCSPNSKWSPPAANITASVKSTPGVLK